MGIATNDDPDLPIAQTANDHVSSGARSEEPPSIAVVSAIADAIGGDPTTMEPLYETVDTEALDTLLRTDASIEIVFEYEGHAIEVGSDGFVIVDGESVVEDDWS